jgi:hypothetical protein
LIADVGAVGDKSRSSHHGKRPQHDRNRIDVLRKQVSRPEARIQVMDFLARRATTRG